MDDRILNKIKKCLALAQSPEPAEAAAALRQAQKLMEMHGVTHADLGRAELGEAYVSSKASVSRLKDWELRLMKLVAKAFGCQILWCKSFSYCDDVFGSYQLIGLKAQVTVAQYTAQVLLRRLIKARSQFVVSLGNLPRGLKSREADGFCHGWIQAIEPTVHKFALPDGIEQLIAERIDELATGKSKPQQRSGGDMGFILGQEAGRGESLHRPMAEQKQTYLAGGDHGKAS